MLASSILDTSETQPTTVNLFVICDQYISKTHEVSKRIVGLLRSVHHVATKCAQPRYQEAYQKTYFSSSEWADLIIPNICSKIHWQDINSQYRKEQPVGRRRDGRYAPSVGCRADASFLLIWWSARLFCWHLKVST